MMLSTENGMDSIVPHGSRSTFPVAETDDDCPDQNPTVLPLAFGLGDIDEHVR